MTVTAPRPAPPESTPVAAGSRPLGRPRRGRLIDTDIAAVLTAGTVCVVGLWVRHGGISALGAGRVEATASISRLSGLLCSALALAGVVLVGRPRSLERMVGLDRMLVWHRIIGDIVGVLLAVHVAAGTISWTFDAGWSTTLDDLLGGEPYIGLAVIGGSIVGVVVLSSLQAIRRRLSYEAWYLVHLTVYVGFALSYGHQIVVGSDLVEDRLARGFWAMLHAGALLSVLWGRWGSLVRSARRPLTVLRSQRLSDDVTAITLGGPHLKRFSAAAGQFAFVRPVSRWWRSHPFSLSAAPTEGSMRFTIKELGAGSADTMRLAVGSKVIVEGPYGITTRELIGDRSPLFVVGGVGVTPVRALLEDLSVTSRPLVLYRARHDDDLVHLDELQALAGRCGGRVLTLVGPTTALAGSDPFSAARLRSLTGDLVERVAILCGPQRLIVAARSGLRAAGVPAEQIHYERVWW